MNTGTMDPKGNSSKKKPYPKSDYQLVNENTESSSNSGDLIEYLIKKKDKTRER